MIFLAPEESEILLMGLLPLRTLLVGSWCLKNQVCHKEHMVLRPLSWTNVCFCSYKLQDALLTTPIELWEFFDRYAFAVLVLPLDRTAI